MVDDRGHVDFDFAVAFDRCLAREVGADDLGDVAEVGNFAGIVGAKVLDTAGDHDAAQSADGASSAGGADRVAGVL